MKQYWDFLKYLHWIIFLDVKLSVDLNHVFESLFEKIRTSGYVYIYLVYNFTVGENHIDHWSMAINPNKQHLPKPQSTIELRFNVVGGGYT